MATIYHITKLAVRKFYARDIGWECKLEQDPPPLPSLAEGSAAHLGDAALLPPGREGQGQLHLREVKARGGPALVHQRGAGELNERQDRSKDATWKFLIPPPDQHTDHRKEDTVTLYKDIFRMVPEQFRKWLVMHYVPITMLAMCWTARPCIVGMS